MHSFRAWIFLLENQFQNLLIYKTQIVRDMMWKSSSLNWRKINNNKKFSSHPRWYGWSHSPPTRHTALEKDKVRWKCRKNFQLILHLIARSFHTENCLFPDALCSVLAWNIKLFSRLNSTATPIAAAAIQSIKAFPYKKYGPRIVLRPWPSKTS